MDINYQKYVKYKKKYLKLQKILLGGNTDIPIGINFESGKIITHIKKCSKCVGYANCQIGMDAPYHGRVANESHRSQGRSEINFPGYREDLLEKNLFLIFSFIKETNPEIKIIIQIARGRSGVQMYEEVIKKILDDIDLEENTDYNVLYGYRTKDYFNCNNFSEKFIFVNIGMFAVLTNPDKVYVGELCNPVSTWNILSYDNQNDFFNIKKKIYNFDPDPRNILNNFNQIQKIKLFGISDTMDFVTPDIYSNNSICKLVDFANNN